MDDNANQALMISFAILVFVIAMSVTMYMFSTLMTTAESLTFHTDETNFYDNVAVVGTEGIERYVNTETVIPTLYRYYKEHFCVKIYDTTNTANNGSSADKPVLVQVLDVNLEGKVENAAKNTRLEGKDSPADVKDYEAFSVNSIYNNKQNWDSASSNKLLYMFGVPWLGSTETMKQRIDFFINGSAGYINNTYVDYREHPFHQMIDVTKNGKDGDPKEYFQFKENFISYSYTGETMTTEDGDVLITGANSKDKIVITYTLVDIRAGKTEKEIQEIQNKINEIKKDI